MARDTVYITIDIQLDSYEIANLLLALDYVPKTGEWYDKIVNKIADAMALKGVKIEEFYYKPNSGLNLKSIRRHLELMEYKEKYPHLKTKKVDKTTEK